jgi:hypothetical protein
LSGAARVIGHPVRSVVIFPDVEPDEALARRTFLMQSCARRGLLYFCSHIPCLAHGDEELAFTLDVMNEAFQELAAAIASGNVTGKLEGEPVSAIFRRP